MMNAGLKKPAKSKQDVEEKKKVGEEDYCLFLKHCTVAFDLNVWKIYRSTCGNTCFLKKSWYPTSTIDHFCWIVCFLSFNPGFGPFLPVECGSFGQLVKGYYVRGVPYRFCTNNHKSRGLFKVREHLDVEKWRVVYVRLGKLFELASLTDL